MTEVVCLVLLHVVHEAERGERHTLRRWESCVIFSRHDEDLVAPEKIVHVNIGFREGKHGWRDSGGAFVC